MQCPGNAGRRWDGNESSEPMPRLLILILVLAPGGCGPSIEEQVRHQLRETFDAQQHLLLAVEAYRLGRGHWPGSPAELRTSKFLDEAVGFDRYVNLRFEPLPGGGLAVRFDRWNRPDGTMGMSGGFDLGPAETARGGTATIR
jgi:hypothetical protein